jgi:Fe-S-cluster containining protein
MNEMIASVTIEAVLACRMGCAACCIAPSISSAIPGMPNGKAAGERCVQLDSDGLCKIFGQLERPKVCGSLQASATMCGANTREAMIYLTELERLTA